MESLRQAHSSSKGKEALPRMSLLEHLEELRDRLIHSVIAIAVAFALFWIPLDGVVNHLAPLLHWNVHLDAGVRGVDLVLDFLSAPIYRLLPKGHKLAFLGVTDPLILYVKVAGLASLFLAAPYILFQFWRFAAPGLYSRERHYIVPVVIASTIFFVGGGAFAYFVAFPFAAQFLLQMGAAFEPVLTVERYFRFLLTILLGLGLMFELPIVLFLLAQLGVVTPRFLMRNFRWAVLIIFIAAAIITPTPDVVNMSLFALPTVGLYLLGTIAAWFVVRSKNKSRDETADSD